MTQADALTILKTGANVFLTGPAGSGKTHVLREYLRVLSQHEIPVGITASTGIAATHMGGVTIHSWSGIGVYDSLSSQDLEEIAKKAFIKNKIEAAKVLIIDEISMLHHYQLDMVDQVTRAIRKNDMPFGGLQVVVCGDFFQLPPVSRFGERESFFAYHSQAWKEARFNICYLEEQHRQIDKEFTGILNAIRAQTVSEEMMRALWSRIDIEGRDDIKPTRLHSHNADVDAENDRELEAIPGRIHEYKMTSHGNKKLVEGLKKSCLSPEILRLKVGAQVMFVKNNWEMGYANGTRGTVVECDHEGILVRTLDGREIEVPRETWHIDEGDKTLAEIEQYPLRLAWAITIHKSQGMSLDAAHIDLSRSFEKGMGYVALSRVRSLLGLTLAGLNDTALHIDPEAFEYDAYFREQSRAAEAELMALPAGDIEQKQQEFLGPLPGEKGYKAKKIKKPKIPTAHVTKALIDEGKTIREVARERELSAETIIGHIEELREEDPNWNISHLRDILPVTRFKKISMAFHQVGVQEGGQRPLSPVKHKLGPGFTFEEIRIVRLFL
jgi:ATP-dependent exoDNAse (exonuclease V) alpha subunit